jgi:hypothetical protein
MTSLIQWAFQQAMPSVGNKAIGFDDVAHSIKHPEKYVLIHTLPALEQAVLIKGTLSASEEESFVNEYLSKYVERPKTIVIYGRNCCDETPKQKLAQLLSLGIGDAFIYVGGLFEWLLLQDIYGEAEFATTGKTLDLLAHRPRSNEYGLEYSRA